MTLSINGDEISEDGINRCFHTGYATGQCDAIVIDLDNGDKQVDAMDLAKGDTVEAIGGVVDTGEMYISSLEYSSGKAIIRALSLPLSCFTAKTRSWENISFTGLVNDLISETPLSLEMDGELTAIYKSVLMVNEMPFRFLGERLSMEGFGIRLSGGTAHIFDEAAEEAGDFTQEYVDEDTITGTKYRTSDAGLIKSITNIFKATDGQLIKTEAVSGIDGMELSMNIPVSSIGESERFTKNLMRAKNKMEYLSEGTIEGLDRLPGDTVWLTGTPPGHDGLNYIYMVESNLLDGSQAIYMRKPMEE